MVSYFVPIDISAVLSNIVVVFLTALLAYLLIKISFQSFISNFSNARNKIQTDNPVIAKKIEGQCFDRDKIENDNPVIAKKIEGQCFDH